MIMEGILLKRITFQVDDGFAKEFSRYCVEHNKSKKSAIIDLLLKEMDKGIMEQYINLNKNIHSFVNFMDSENYKRLSKFKIEDKEPWDMRSNLPVNKNINKYFENDETLSSLIDFLNQTETKELSIPYELLDHYYYVKFNNKDIDYHFEHLYGIMTFPYIDFKRLEEIIYSWNTKFWNLYIINPALMKYQKGHGLGLFITPIYYYDAIAEYNGFFETLTGYKLFYLWTNNNEINPITQNKKAWDIQDWLKNLKDEDFPKMYKKAVEFWHSNRKKIKCNALENSYFQFTHKMPYAIPSLLVLTLQGSDFEMINKKTGWTTGKCNKIEFDLKAFKCIYVDRKEVKFTEEMLKDFKDGNFEFILI